MINASATYRYSMALMVLALCFTGCGPAPDDVSVKVVDLARTIDSAERRPAAGFDVAVHVADGVARPSIVVPVPARAIWSLPLPRHGLFRAFLTVDAAGTAAPAVRVRLGISDNRVYEGLAERTLTPGSGWTEFRADLSAYAGIQASLFYRPDRITWRLVLSTDRLGPAPARAVVGSPEILTDVSSAKEYLTRRRQIR